jgi:hypothetical protein
MANFVANPILNNLYILEIVNLQKFCVYCTGCRGSYIMTSNQHRVSARAFFCVSRRQFGVSPE